MSLIVVDLQLTKRDVHFFVLLICYMQCIPLFFYILSYHCLLRPPLVKIFGPPLQVEALAVLKRSVAIIHHAWVKSFPLIMRHTSFIGIMLRSWDSVSGENMQT
jgi:hypothetical protein